MSLRRFRAAGFVAAASLLLVPAMASADDSSVVDASKNGSSSLTVVKYERSATNGVVEGDGTATTQPEGATLEGAQFTLKKVGKIGDTDVSNLDYTKNGTWSTLGKLLNGNSQPTGAVSYTSDNPILSNVTAGDGVATFANLKFGVYEVTETTVPTNATPSAPFYVTLPFPQDNSYIYDVTAYPKNAIESITKATDDSAIRSTAGVPISYTITTSVNPYAETTQADGSRLSNISTYVITDKLDARLTYKGVKLALSTDPDTELDPSTYTANVDAATNTLTISFTDFAALNAAAKVGTTLATTISAELNSGGDITDLSNSATFVPNQDAHWSTEGVSTDTPVVVELGRIEVTKKDAKTGNALAGAVFKLQDENGADLTFFDKTGKAVTETTSDADGSLYFGGLRTSDQSNGENLDAPVQYQIVEVTAPDGYAKLPEPVKVTLATQDGTNGSITTLDIENAPRAAFALPFTGAAGTAFILVVALVVLAAGAGIYAAARQKAQK